MDPSALVFLDTTDARKLAVAWRLLGEDRTDIAWATLAGVSPVSAARHRHALTGSGICREDGTTDDLALRYVAQIAGKAAGASRRPRARQPDPDKRTAG